MGKNTQTLEPKEITPEQIESLLEKAREIEWKYLLVLDRWTREMSAFNDSADFKIVYGKAEEVILRKPEPSELKRELRVAEEVLLIPKTIPVIVLWESRVESDNGFRVRIVYIFTGSGWKSVLLET